MQRNKLSRHLDLPTLISALAAALILAALSILNLPVWGGELGKLLTGQLSFGEYTAAVQSDLHSDSLWHKDDFVTLRGFFDRLSCRRQVNEVVKLNNGMLTGLTPQVDAEQLAEGIADFSDFLASEGIPYLYVQAPLKLDAEGTLLPAGINDYALDNSSRLVSALREKNVDTLDLWPVISGTARDVEQNFYRTDHHWNADGAFLAFQTLMEQISESYFGLDLTCTDPAQWERTVVPDALLGSSGRREGPLYGGVDDLICITPLFETQMSFTAPGSGVYRAGSFSQTLIWEEYLTAGDLYHTDNYSFYLGGGYPLELHRNADAPNSQRILLIKDSFAQPVIAFLSAAFREIDVIDPRYYEGSTAAYAAAMQPDLVITLICPGSATQTYSDNGTVMARARQQLEPEERERLHEAAVTLEAGDSAYNSLLLCEDLQAGGSYTLTARGITLDQGAADFMSLLLYCPESGQIFWQTAVDIGYANAGGGFSASFSCPEELPGKLRLLIYAGIPGKTQGIGLTLRDVCLTQTVYAGGFLQPVYARASLDYSAGEQSYANWRADYALAPGTSYQVTVTGLQTVNESGFWAAALLADHAAVWTGLMRSDKTERSFTVTTPDAPGDYRIAIYPSTPGLTAGSSITISSLCISRLFPEEGAELLTARDLSLQAPAEHAWFCDSLPVNLLPGGEYTISMDNIRIDSGSPEGTELRLFGAESRNTLAAVTLTPGSGSSWSFTVPEGENAGLLAYTGIPGKTGGVGLTYEGISIRAAAPLGDCGMVLQQPEAAGSEICLNAELRPGRMYYVAFTIEDAASPIRIGLIDANGTELPGELDWDPEAGETSFGGIFTVPDDLVGWNDCQVRILTDEPVKLTGICISYLSA